MESPPRWRHMKGTSRLSNFQQKPKTKKVLNQEALTASLEYRWDDAIALNDEILERFPRDAEALNRKGRAYMEQGKLAASREAYSDALKADPANMIARRNLQRLETIYQADGADETAEPRNMGIPRGAVFVEEIGKTWIDDLTHPVENGILALVAPGDMLKLVVEGERVFVKTMKDVLLGQVDQSIGSRMAKLMGIGHEFEAYALGQSMNSLRFIIQETVRAEESAGTMTFPRQVPPHLDLLREREQLSLREEGDFLFGEEEDEEDDIDAADDIDDEDAEEEEEPAEDTDDDYLADASVDPDEDQPAE